MRTSTAPSLDREKTTTRTRKPVRKVEAIRRIIKGTAASFGVAEGPAVVLKDCSDLAVFGHIPRGSVLVCSSATPDLAIVIPGLKAIAAECGGMLSAAAGTARECGVPAVVGATSLTAIVNSGDIVRIDGTRGIVEVVAKRSLKSI